MIEFALVPFDVHFDEVVSTEIRCRCFDDESAAS